MGTVPTDLQATPDVGEEVIMTVGASDIRVFRLPFPAYVWGLECRVSLDVAGAVLPIISLDVADADGATNRTEIVAINFTTSDDGGDTRADVVDQPVYVALNRVVVLELKQSAAGGGAGAGDCFILWAPSDRGWGAMQDI